MEAAIKAFVQQVANENRNKIRQAMRTVSKRVEADFMEQASKCLDSYYSEYSPLVYERTGNLRDNSIQPYKRYRANEFDVGVAFSPSGMNKYYRSGGEINNKDKPYIKNTEELVVYNAMSGIHGNSSIYVGRNIDETMMHFTSAYAHWFLDGYFKELLNI
jgi:hypothetical protein